jgi:hypothetical protein
MKALSMAELANYLKPESRQPYELGWAWLSHSLGHFARRSLSFRPVHQLAAAIRADILHLTGAFITKSAFIRADHRHAI